MEQNEPITILPVNKRAFIRKITLPLDNKDSYYTPFAAYVRIPYPGYNMEPKEMSQFDRCIYGYEDTEYPHDCLDDVILSALTEFYKRATRKSSFSLLNSELINAKTLYQNKGIISKDIFIEVTNTSQDINGCSVSKGQIQIPIRIYFPLKKINTGYPLLPYPLTVSYNEEQWDQLRTFALGGSLVQYDEFINN